VHRKPDKEHAKARQGCFFVVSSRRYARHNQAGIDDHTSLRPKPRTHDEQTGSLFMYEAGPTVVDLAVATFNNGKKTRRRRQKESHCSLPCSIDVLVSRGPTSTV